MSDRLYRAAHITAMAETVFGNKVKARRWLNKPKERFSGETPMAMLSTLQAAAMLEVLVHLEIDPDDISDGLRLMRIEAPDRIIPQVIGVLPAQWEGRHSITQRIGDNWLASKSSLLLTVPSAIMPHTNNVLFKPAHPDAPRATFAVETLRLDRRPLKGPG